MRMLMRVSMLRRMLMRMLIMTPPRIPLLLIPPAILDPIPALDDVRLETYRPRSPVELQEESAGVAEDGARLVAPPEGSRACFAVLADGLGGGVSISSLNWGEGRRGIHCA